MEVQQAEIVHSIVKEETWLVHIVWIDRYTENWKGGKVSDRLVAKRLSYIIVKVREPDL